MALTKKTFLALFLAILVLFLVVNLFDNPLRNLVYKISAPLQSRAFSQGQSLAGFLAGLFNSQDIVSQNSQLLKQNLLLESKMLELANLEKENEQLRVALKMGLATKLELSLVKVVAVSQEQENILIQLDSSGELKEDMPVVTAENVLVGSVSKVFGRFGQVNLISQENFSFDVALLGGAIGLAQGDGFGKLKLKNVSQEAELISGAIVATANLSGKFPANLLVGQLISFQKNPAEPFQEGQIEPYFTKNKLDNLFVIMDWPIDN